MFMYNVCVCKLYFNYQQWHLTAGLFMIEGKSYYVIDRCLAAAAAIM